MSMQAIALADIETQEAAEKAVERDVQRVQILSDLELEYVGGGAVIAAFD